MTKEMVNSQVSKDFYKVIEGTISIDTFITKWENKAGTMDILMSEDEEIQKLWQEYCNFTISRTGFMYCILWVGVIMCDLIEKSEYDKSHEVHNIAHKLILALQG